MNLTGRQPFQKDAKPVKVPALRNAARNETCTLRLPGCNGDTATTVLAHLRFFGAAGTAGKPADYKAVFACSACHDQLDRRASEASWGWDDILRALMETLDRQYASGNLHMGKQP